MILYNILYFSFLLVPFLLVALWIYIYPNFFKPYSEIFKNLYILIIATIVLYLTIKILIYLPNIDINNWIGNFYLHAIWWWVICSILFLYIANCTSIYTPRITRFIIFFMFLCTMWICNELLEFSLEYFRLWWVWAMSASPRDTRQDLFANTVWGIIWFIITQFFYNTNNK